MSEQYDPSVSEFHPDPVNLSGGTIVGHGAPDNSVGNDGQYYFDQDSAILYFKNGGVWSVVSGSTTVTGGGGTTSGAVEPEGVATAVPGTIYTNTTDVPPTIWVKITGSGNTGWTQVV